MASVDAMPLTPPLRKPGPGAAFHLASAAPESATLQIDGYEIEVAHGSQMIVVRSSEPLSEADIVSRCLRYALRGLDHLAARGTADLTITRAAENRLTWTPGVSGLVITINDTLPLGIAFSGTITVHDAQGNIVPPPPQPPAAWHESMRYFRYSQLAEDELDALRNLWLATENMLDSQCPQQRGEREGAWLRRALTFAGTIVDLREYLPTPSTDPVAEAFRYFYSDLRTHLFHAKHSRQPALPAEAATVSLGLVARHHRLTELYLALLWEITGVQRAGTRLSYQAFDRMVAAVFSADSTLGFSDDPSPVAADAETFTPLGGQAIWAPVRHEIPSDRLGWHHLTGEVTGDALEPLRTVRRMGIVNGGQPAATAALDYVLETSQTQTLRGCISVRLRNHRQPAAFVAF